MTNPLTTSLPIVTLDNRPHPTKSSKANPLQPVFEHLLNINAFQLQTASRLALVCKNWAKIIDSRTFWKELFRKTGVHLPFCIYTNHHQAYANELGYILEARVSKCKKYCMKDIDVNINFEECTRVHFIQDSIVVAHTHDKIFSCALNNVDNVKEIRTPSNILSLGIWHDLIYCALENRQILAYSIGSKEVLPSLTLEANAEDLSDPLIPKGRFEIFTSDRWLVYVTHSKIKKLNPESGTLVSTYDAPSIMSHLQLDCNKLYWTAPCKGGSSLYCLDLIRDQLIRIKDIEGTVSDIQIQGNQCAYIVQPFNKSDESLLNLITFDIFTPDNLSVYEKITESQENLKMFISHKLVVLVSSEDDQDELKMIDLKTRAQIHLTNEYSIHRHSLNYAVSIFHDTILFANTENQVVKITFR